jgi:hypothetical protein
MQITKDHLTGFLVGVGVSGLGFYLYRKNQSEVDDFLRRHGIELPDSGPSDYAALTLEQLVKEKERLEDLIADRQHHAMADDAALSDRTGTGKS